MAFPLGLHTQAYPYCLQHFGQHNTVPLGLHAFLTYQLIITQNILITQFSELFIGLHPLSRTKPTVSVLPSTLSDEISGVLL